MLQQNGYNKRLPQNGHNKSVTLNRVATKRLTVTTKTSQYNQYNIMVLTKPFQNKLPTNRSTKNGTTKRLQQLQQNRYQEAVTTKLLQRNG